MKHKIFALVDCNNFFASCERIFRPDLKKNPIVVLSSNDGCVVARSKETKDLGIPMGAPYFKIKDEIKMHKITVFSSNFPLYQNISARVMAILESYNLPLQIYSIDEAFIDFSNVTNRVELAFKIYYDIWNQVGIPVSVGIAPTKTLAKIATEIAKKNQEKVYEIFEANIDQVINNIKIHDVWGIGRQHSIFLKSFGIDNALHFKQLSNHWVRKKMGVNGEKIWQELRGVSCLALDEIHELPKSIVRSKSFGQKIYDFEVIFSAITNHIFDMTRELREINLSIKNFKIFISTSRFEREKYFASEEIILDIPTNDFLVLNSLARKMLQKIFKTGFAYKKAGVYSTFLINHDSLPNFNLFNVQTDSNSDLMRCVDFLNKKYGKNVVQTANILGKNTWKSKNSLKSPEYTTNWEQIFTIKT